jgi:hypothetical protein
MEPNTPQHHIREAVQNAIATGEVTMRSPIHFLFKTVVLIGAMCAIFVLSTIILNFILFSIQVQSHHELLGFGVPGFLAFLNHFPWLLFFIDVALVIVVLYMLRTFSLGYKVPVAYLGVALLCIVVSLGFLVEEASEPMNRSFMIRVDDGRLPRPLPMFTDGIRTRPVRERSLCTCEIIEVREGGSLTARDIRTGDVLTFIVQPGASRATTTGLTQGDIVFIAGSFDGDGDEDDRVTAFGIKHIDR